MAAFSVMHVVDRWRFPGTLGLALAAGSELQYWRARSGRLRPLATALALGIVVDLAVYAYQCLPSSWGIPPQEVHLPEGPPSTSIVNIGASELYRNTEGFECLSKGYGVIQGYTPQLGYDRGATTPTLATIPTIWGSGLEVPPSPTYWSPNRIEFLVDRTRKSGSIRIREAGGGSTASRRFPHSAAPSRRDHSSSGLMPGDASFCRSVPGVKGKR